MALTDRQREILRGSFLCEQLNPDGTDAFLGGLCADTFPAGQEIYSASRFFRAIGIITRGAAVVEGSQGVALNTLRVGDCFGVAALFHPVEEYVTTVRAKLFAEVVFITGEQLTALFAREPQAAINYIAFLSRRVDFLNRKIASFTAPSARDALALWLLENQRDGAATVGQGYAQLARQLNIGRASLYRSLDALEQEGVIRRADKVVTLLQPEKLHKQCMN